MRKYMPFFAMVALVGFVVACDASSYTNFMDTLETETTGALSATYTKLLAVFVPIIGFTFAFFGIKMFKRLLAKA